MTQQLEFDEDVVQVSEDTGRSRLETVIRWLIVLGFPASLTSPGATISMGLVALYGVALVREGRLPDDLRRAHQYMLVCYLLVVGVDMVNGGGLLSLAATAINYLPLLALAPYAHVLRKLALDRQVYDRAIQATLAIAVTIPAIRIGLFGEYRPGGINLAPIGYGFVVSLWTVYMFSRALEQRQGAAVSHIATLAGFISVLMTQSKIGIACVVLGCVLTAGLWARENGRWRELVIGLIGGGALVGMGGYVTVYPRFAALWYELRHYIETGSIIRESFGARFEQISEGWAAFMDRPILGHGFAERMDAVSRHSGILDVTALSYLHNDYFTHLVSFGIFGLAFMLAYFVLVLVLVRKSADPANRRASIALVFMLALYAGADVVFNMDPITGAVTIALGMTLAASARNGSPAKDRHGIDGKSTKVA
jgi:O-antigen ligase